MSVPYYILVKYVADNLAGYKSGPQIDEELMQSLRQWLEFNGGNASNGIYCKETLQKLAKSSTSFIAKLSADPASFLKSEVRESSLPSPEGEVKKSAKGYRLDFEKYSSWIAALGTNDEEKAIEAALYSAHRSAAFRTEANTRSRIGRLTKLLPLLSSFIEKIIIESAESIELAIPVEELRSFLVSNKDDLDELGTLFRWSKTRLGYNEWASRFFRYPHDKLLRVLVSFFNGLFPKEMTGIMDELYPRVAHPKEFVTAYTTANNTGTARIDWDLIQRNVNEAAERERLMRGGRRNEER